MAWTYTAGSTSTRNRVRLEIGDTTEARALFSDEELDDIIVQETDVYPSAARACEMLATRFAREFDFSADGASFRKSSVASMYQAMARRLRARGHGVTVVVPRRVGGYSQTTPSDDVTASQ